MMRFLRSMDDVILKVLNLTGRRWKTPLGFLLLAALAMAKVLFPEHVSDEFAGWAAGLIGGWLGLAIHHRNADRPAKSL